MADIAEELKAVSSIEVEEACTAYALDGYAPQVVVKPTSAEEVRAVLDVCRRRRAPGVVWGGGTHVHIGSPMQEYVWAMDMRGLSRPIDHSPSDLVVTVEAGMTLGQLQNLLQPHHQWLPIDAPLPDVQTVGGIVASGGAGPRRLRYGLPREWLLAVRAVLASGEIVKAGVGVVKNVAGYDLPRLFAGSWGTLGVLVALTFKVAPLPEVSFAVRLAFADAQSLHELYDALNHPLLQAEMLEVVYQPGAGWHLYCGLAGFEEDVRWQFDFLRDRVRAEWAQVTLDELHWLRDRRLLVGAQCRCRCVVPPARITEILVWAHQRLPEAELQAHFGTGVAYVWWLETVPSPQALRELRAQARSLGGFCVLEHAPAEVKREVGVWDAVSDGVGVMRRLKEGFDPQRILAPGRFVEGL
ncbi:MAG: FAD-binding oxidoreductase [Armatimonadota bacterium]